MTSPLGERLARDILSHGPIDLAQFMTLALHHPTEGYYATSDPLGLAGDFTTSPEISQAFGELIGLALAQSWLDLGRPAPSYLVELGPGRGALMADAMRASAKVAGFHGSIRLHLVETSPALKARQLEAVGEFGPVWHEDLSSLPEDGPLLLIANEFLDALPIRQLVRHGRHWQERHVAADQEGRLGFVLLPRPGLPPYLSDLEAPEDQVIEISPAREILVEEISGRLAIQQGVAYLVDYGRDGPVGDSFQAVRRHAKVDVLAEPGLADLSSHVDFGAIVAAASRTGCRVYGPISQGMFLERLGISTRRAQLTRNRDAVEVEAIELAIDRLVHPAAMGELFKVVAISTTASPPPGFVAAEERRP